MTLSLLVASGSGFAEPAPATPSQPVLPAGVTWDQPPEQWLPVLRPGAWQPLPPSASSVRLGELLQSVQDHDSDILASRAHELETAIKQESIKLKRLLFFFRYFNAEQLEAAADSDVRAAEARTRAVTQGVLLKAAQAHLKLSESLLDRHEAMLALRASVRQWYRAEGAYRLGQMVSYDVAQAREALLGRAQSLAVAEQAYAAASLALYPLLSGDGSGKPMEALLPAELSWGADGPILTPPPTVAWPEDPVADALLHRADLAELSRRRQSLEALSKNAVLGATQQRMLRATVQQMDARREKLSEEIVLQVRQSWAGQAGLLEQIPMAEARVSAARQRLEDLQRAFALGQPSRLDVEDAADAVALAQSQRVRLTLALWRQQTQRLAALGRLSPAAFSEAPVSAASVLPTP